MYFIDTYLTVNPLTFNKYLYNLWYKTIHATRIKRCTTSDIGYKLAADLVHTQNHLTFNNLNLVV